MTDRDEAARVGDGNEEAIHEATLRTSVEVNAEPAGILLDESIAIAHGQDVLGSTEGSSVVIDGEEVPGDGNKEATSEAILRKNVEVNREPVVETFDESIAIVHGQAVLRSTEGSSVINDGKEVPGDGNEEAIHEATLRKKLRLTGSQLLKHLMSL